jgi:hypothetical protein
MKSRVEIEDGKNKSSEQIWKINLENSEMKFAIQNVQNKLDK